jgi:hypothetical protein
MQTAPLITKTKWNPACHCMTKEMKENVLYAMRFETKFRN